MGGVLSSISDCLHSSADATPAEHELGVARQSDAEFQAQMAGQVQHQAPGSSLTEEDRATLRHWEERGHHIDLALSRGDADPERVSKVDAAFAKLSPYKGVMYTNIGFRPSTKGGGDAFTEEQAERRFALGKTHASKEYVSGTPDPGIARNNNTRFGLDVALATKTSTAADLRPVATMHEQAEVILARNKPLTVTNVKTVTETGEQTASTSSRGRTQERRFLVFAHTPNSSPVRPADVDSAWLAWASLSRKDAVESAMGEISDDGESIRF